MDKKNQILDNFTPRKPPNFQMYFLLPRVFRRVDFQRTFDFDERGHGWRVFFFSIVNHSVTQPAKKNTNVPGEISLAHLQPNLLSFSSTISACEKAGEWQKALLLLESTSSARLSPDVIIYSAPRSERWSEGWSEVMKPKNNMIHSW